MDHIKADNKKIAKNTIFLYIRMLLILGITLYTSRVVLRYLGVVDFGINNVVAGFVSLFAFLNVSLNGAIQRFYNYEGGLRGDKGIIDVYITSFFIQIFLAIILLVLTETIGLWYVYNVMVIPDDRFMAAVILYHVSIISLILVVMEIPYSAIILSLERMDYYAFVSIFDAATKLLLVLLLPYLPGDRLVLFSIVYLVVSLVDFLLYYVYAKKKLKLQSVNFRCFNKALFKSMMSFSGWNLFGTFANVAQVQGVNLILNFFFGPVVNAARGISSQISSAIRGFYTNIVVSFRPQLVDSYAKGQYERTSKILFLEAKSSYLMVLFLMIPLIIEMNQILHLWLGEKIPQYSALFSSLVLINTLVASCNAPFTQMIHAIGKLKKFHLVTSFLAVITLPISFVFLKIGFNPEVVFIVCIVTGVISQVACVVIVRQYYVYSIREYLRRVIYPCLLVTLFSPILPIAVASIMDVSLMRLLLVGLTSVSSTLLFSYLFALDNNERKKVLTHARKLVEKFKEKREY